MCVVQMETKDTKKFHIFSLELRPATDKSVMHGFYVYSSWQSRFGLKWFLGHAEKMRSEIPKKKQEKLAEAYGADGDEKHENLKTTCGDMKFLTTDKLFKCLQKFAVIFDEGDTKDCLNKLFFSFECEELNQKFKELI